MGPTLTVNNIANMSATDRVLLGYARLHNALFKQGANVKYVLFTQLGLPVDDANGLVAVSRFLPVPHVVSLRSCVEMCGIATGTVVTAMQDHKSSRDASIRKDVCGSVGAICSVLHGTMPVSEVIQRTCPYPTRTKFRAMLRGRAVLINLRPKPRFFRRAGGAGFARFNCAENVVGVPFARHKGGLVPANKSVPWTDWLSATALAQISHVKRQLNNILYNHGIKSPSLRFGHTPDVSASRGFIVP